MGHGVCRSRKVRRYAVSLHFLLWSLATVMSTSPSQWFCISESLGSLKLAKSNSSNIPPL